MKAVSMLIALLAAAVPASAADVELLGQPCRAKQILGACVVTDREDGRERLVLLNNNETHGCELLYIDFEKDTGVVYPAPAGSGSWTVVEVAGDRLVIGTFYDGVFMVFDLVGKKFIKVADFAGEQYVWNLARGTDGRVYGGTYPGAKLGALDLSSYAVEDLGAPVLPNQYLRYVSATPWGEIFANFMSNRSTTRIYDIAGRRWREVPGLKEGQVFGMGVTWNGYFVAHDPRTGEVEAFKDATLVPVPVRPFPTPGEGSFGIEAGLCDAKTLYLRKENVLYRYEAERGGSELTRVASVDLRGGRYVAVARDGRLLGVRGQSYFVMKPGENRVDLRAIPVESRGRPPLFLAADWAGKIWGGPHFGQTLFHYDIATGATVNTGVVCDGGGEVYDVAFGDGCVYAASYAGGDITCYDPRRPWDQWSGRNPHLVARVGTLGYIRPVGGIVFGPDGQLYAGWMAKYGTYGGAVSIVDPKTGSTRLVENPLGEQAVCGLDVDARHIYVGTSLGANGLPNQSGEVKFGMLDRVTGRVQFATSFAASSVEHVVVEPVSSRVAFVVQRRLALFDPETTDMTMDPIPGLPELTARSVVAVGDGTLIAGAGTRIVRIDVMGKGYAVVAEAPGMVGYPTLADDHRVYFNVKADLYRTSEPLVRGGSGAGDKR